MTTEQATRRMILVKCQRILKAVAATALAIAMANVGHAADRSVTGSGLMDLTVLQDGAPEFAIETRIMGPRWSTRPCLGWDHHALPTVEGGNTRVYDNPKTAIYENWFDYPKKPLHPFGIRQEVTSDGKSGVRLLYKITPREELTLGGPKEAKSLTVGAVIAHTTPFDGGKCVVTQADGKNTEIALPVDRNGFPETKEVVLTNGTGESFRIVFDPPLCLHCDAAELRFYAGQDKPVAAGQTYTQKIAVTFPGAIGFEPANRMVDKSSWFPLDVAQANDTARPSFLPREGWNDKPAGAKGWIRMEKDKLVLEKTNEEIKLWGTNPLKVEGDCDENYLRTSAALMAKYGMNVARFHAFTKPHREGLWAHMLRILDPQDGLKFHEGHLGLLDYGFAQMKANGIYTKFSVNYGWYPTDACWKRMINAEDAKALLDNQSFYHKHALMPDVQEMLIQCHVNLLNHVNPHTGLRYADDPALAILELQNEENIFLGMRDHERQLAKAPAYKKLFYKKFADWLKALYGTREELAKAWGDALRAEDSLEEANLSPFPAWMPPDAKPSLRYADQVHFLYSVQLDFYQRWEKAVRATGYKGMLVGSCWQAVDWVGHLYNVLSDRAVGIIDRHNYNTINLRAPGLGLMSAGFQNVIDRPFSFSEWSGGSRPGERLDVSQVALYGMGLQGWDASMQFAWGYPGMMPNASTGVNSANNEFPILAQFPALSRMVIRKDVAEGGIVGNRRISVPALQKSGDVGFTEQFSLLGGANNKSFNAAVPSAALAAGRVVMEFVDGSVEKPVIDESSPFIDKAAKVVRANNKQLEWHYGPGFVRFDTAASLGYVGQAGGRTLEFGRAKLKPKTPMASVYFTANGPGETLANAKSILVTTVARGVNSPDVIDELSATALHSPVWNAPPEKHGTLVVEPVELEVEWKGAPIKRIVALDHGGSLTDPVKTIPFEKKGGAVRFTLDGKTTKAFYYLIECE